MTITTSAPAAGSDSESPVADGKASRRIHWKVIQRGLWIGKRDGEFAGMIESTTNGTFAAMTSLGEQLGNFGTVDAAKQSFAA